VINTQLRFVAIVSLLLFGFVAPVAAETIVLKADRWLNVSSGRIFAPARIVITDGIITAVDPKTLPRDAKVIELGDMTLMPGLMDLHTHVAYEDVDGWQYESATKSTGFYAMRSVRNARKILLAGFTTIRELGSPGFVDVELAKATDLGWVEGPRVIPSGHAIGITGGHCDVTRFKPGLLEMDYRSGIADGVDGLIKAVRYQIKHGAESIKICVTSGVMSAGSNAGILQLSQAELRAIVEEAHRQKVKVTGHAHGKEGIIAASNAGIDSIEHASMMDAETIKILKQNGTYVVPTIFQWFLEYDLPPEVHIKNEYVKSFIANSMTLAIKENVKIAFGTDAGLYPYGRNAEEFAVLVKFGMQPIEAIQTATINAADLMGIKNRGKIEKGLLADIIGVPGNPLKDIKVMENVGFVMKGGIVYKSEFKL